MSEDYSASFQICDPNNVWMTLTVTMTMSDWKKLLSQLPPDYPAWKLGDTIRDLVQRADRILTEERP